VFQEGDVTIVSGTSAIRTTKIVIIELIKFLDTAV
jgi:hypothetical protein